MPDVAQVGKALQRGENAPYRIQRNAMAFAEPISPLHGDPRADVQVHERMNRSSRLQDYNGAIGLKCTVLRRLTSVWSNSANSNLPFSCVTGAADVPRLVPIVSNA